MVYKKGTCAVKVEEGWKSWLEGGCCSWWLYLGFLMVVMLMMMMMLVKDGNGKVVTSSRTVKRREGTNIRWTI